MTASRPIEFDHLGLGQLLKRHRLAVPLHQREYSWTDKEVSDLLRDLSNAISTGKTTYFLGTFVVMRATDGQLLVIDGQQRIATTCILLAAIRDYLFAADDDMLVTSLEEFLFIIVRGTRTREPRLTLNVDDNEYFRTRIVARPDDKARKKAVPLKPSHRLIEQAAKLAAKHVVDILEPFAAKNRIAHLTTWTDFIEDNAQVILAIPPDEVNAFVLFETQNDRGLRTSQADLLKNFLFQEAGPRISEAQHRWSTMRGTIEAIDDELTLTYLRHMTISQYGFTRERDVLERIRDNVKNKVQAINFLDAAAESANDYVALMSPQHAKWNSYSPNTREHVRTLNMLKVTPLRPVMLSVLQKFSKANTEKAFRLFVYWSVRFLIAGGMRSGVVEETLAMTAHGISTGIIQSAAALLESMSKVIPTDAEFKTAFGTKRVSNNGLARYLLRALEMKLQDQPEPEWIPNEDIVINLEHVLPQRFDDSWESFDEDSAADYCTRIGNMVLLKATPNSTIGNQDFAVKKAQYLQSTFALTKEVGKVAKWDSDAIESRQNKLADLAVKTWPLGEELASGTKK